MATLLVLVVLGAAFASVQLLARSVPAPRFSAAAPIRLSVAGPAPVLPLPPQGEASVGVLGVGTIGSSGGDRPLPIASLTKIMTAYLILRDHPLSVGQQGPSIPITARDVAAEQADAAGRQSVVAVAAGEQLSELQALEAILVPSANNVAHLLARWDAGSVTAFVDKMNAEAAALGLRATHYTDPAGLLPSTVSSAADQVRLAALAMQNKVFSSIVALPQVNLPVAGTVFNYNALVGHDGIIGIKTGSTAQAGGCLVFAAARSVGGVPVTIIGSVLGQQGTPILQAALNAGLALVDAASSALRVVKVSLPAGGVVGHVVAPWARPVPVVAPGSWSLVGWPGMTVSERVQPASPGPTVRAGQPEGSVELSVNGESKRFPMVAMGNLPRPSLSWRLERSL